MKFQRAKSKDLRPFLSLCGTDAYNRELSRRIAIKITCFTIRPRAICLLSGFVSNTLWKTSEYGLRLLLGLQNGVTFFKQWGYKPRFLTPLTEINNARNLEYSPENRAYRGRKLPCPFIDGLNLNDWQTGYCCVFRQFEHVSSLYWGHERQAQVIVWYYSAHSLLWWPKHGSCIAEYPSGYGADCD